MVAATNGEAELQPQTPPASTAAPPTPTTAPKPPPEELDDADACAVCLDAKRTHIFGPCGHQCACEVCAEKVMANDRLCPLCRTECSMIMRVYY